MITIRRLIFPLFLTGVMASCYKPAPQTPNSAQSVKRYHLSGRVVSTDKRANSVMIDGDDIPGFMAAMTMPYPVKDSSLMDKLKPGDQITADVVVRGDDSWLENAIVTGHSTPPKTTAQLHIP